MVSFSIQALWFKDHLSAGYTRPKITPNFFLNNCFPSQKNRSIRSNDSVLSRHAHFFNWGIPGDCRFHTSPNLSQNTNIGCWPVKGLVLDFACWPLDHPFGIQLQPRVYDVWSLVDCCLRIDGILENGIEGGWEILINLKGKYLSKS